MRSQPHSILRALGRTGALLLLGLLAAPLAAQVSNTNISGYLDSAVIRSGLRFRFDAAFGADRADRAEFFYAKCGCYRVAGLDPGAPGPAPDPPPPDLRIIETEIDFQEISFDFEWAIRDRFSLFVELPVRSIDPEVNADATGFSDVKVGFKFALIAEPDRWVTLQLRGYVPSGDPAKGLGTDHGSLEPGILWFERLSERLALAAELRWWHPTSGSTARGVGPVSGLAADASDDFFGDVLRFGLGVGYDFAPAYNLRVAPIAELVGWSVLDGFATKSTDGTPTFVTLGGPPNAEEADVTILNLKLGARIKFRERDSLYLGYGTALTGDVWYEDIVRFNYELSL